MKKIAPCVIWLTGYSGAGKSSIAAELEKQLSLLGIENTSLDGDVVREGLCQDLGFSNQDRAENIRRIGYVAHQMFEAGLVVVCAFISPFQHSRDNVRSLFSKGNFIEVFVDTPLTVCEQRDIKGLYKKARAGEIKDFTGIDSLYEKPLKPEIRIEYQYSQSPTQAAAAIMDYLSTNVHPDN